MSGVAIVRALLAASPQVTQYVPADVASARLVAGYVTQGGKLPAISVVSIWSSETETTARNLNVKMIRERVQVTVYGNTQVVVETVLKAASLGKGIHTGLIKGFKVRSVLPAGTGPYLGPGGNEIHEQSRDFMVTFIEAN